MNTVLFEFYKGTGKNTEGRYIADMLNMTDYQLEKSHTVIQWLFPLREPSNHNPNAPLLDDSTIEAMRNDTDCIMHFYAAEERLWKFLTEDCSHLMENAPKPHWITKRNHNFLRLTRIIKCMKMFLPPVAEMFYSLGKQYYESYPNIIGEETWKFWNEVMYGKTQDI